MDLSKLTLQIFSSLEKKWLSDCQNANVWKKTRILSIDGGGSKGLVAADVLIHLEDQIKAKTGDPTARIADFFDLIAGTGIGGIVAAMLTADDGNGRPLYTASQAVKFLKDNRCKMFKPVGIFRRRRFSGTSFDCVLQEAFGRAEGRDLTLKDTCKPLLVPCYDLNSNAPFVFSQADAVESASFDFELWKVCRATTATPRRFKPFELRSVDGKTCCVAVDGGLVMNNPSAAAVTHVLHNKRDFPSVSGVGDLLVLSLGSGICGKPLLSRGKMTRDCSTLAVVEIVLDGVSETVDQILGNAFCWNRSDYLRIQPNGIVGRWSREEKEEGEGVRVLKEKVVESLPFGGKRLLKESNGERIERFVERLVASGKALSPSPSKKPTTTTTAEVEVSTTRLPHP
ncbi:probable inactive patatin-like protein 9 [Aristolochia californica]|uniref:probable inactive patatin-like protein 9 n=1 Tax=Aristolochia californica TaxID=171875 RepID=UPI0035E01ED4